MAGEGRQDVVDELTLSVGDVGGVDGQIGDVGEELCEEVGIGGAVGRAVGFGEAEEVEEVTGDPLAGLEAVAGGPGRGRGAVRNGAISTTWSATRE